MAVNPDHNIELTDDELLAVPARMLTREQRAKRRKVRNNRGKAKTRARRREAQKNGLEAKRIFCTGIKQNGDTCSSYAVIGSEFCGSHMPQEERDRLGIVRRPREAGPLPITGPQLAREVTETAIVKVLQPYFRALGLEILQIDEETGTPVVRDMGEDAGLMLHGESKDGYIHMSKYPDLAGRIQAAEKLFDRVYGRPRQTTVLEGGVKPIQVQPVRTLERSQQMARLLDQLGQGRQLSPAPPGVSELESEVIEGQVVHLRHDDDSEDSDGNR